MDEGTTGEGSRGNAADYDRPWNAGGLYGVAAYAQIGYRLEDEGSEEIAQPSVQTAPGLAFAAPKQKTAFKDGW